MIKKSLRFSLLLFVLIPVFTLFARTSLQGDTNSPRLYELQSEAYTDSLRQLYGENKVIQATDFEQQFLIALSHYPELRDVKIILKSSNENTTMACRPKISTLFGGRRTYYILVNTRPDFDGVLLENVPFNAQVGVIGHEIAHIVDYESKSLFGIIRTGLHYLVDDKKRELEHYIDALTASRGLGWQLYDWASYVMFDSEYTTEAYREFKRRIYMSPEQILVEIGG